MHFSRVYRSACFHACRILRSWRDSPWIRSFWLRRGISCRSSVLFYLNSLVGIFLVQFPISLVLRPIQVLPGVSVSCLAGIFVLSPVLLCSCSWNILALRCRIFPAVVHRYVLFLFSPLPALVLGAIWQVFQGGGVVLICHT